MFPSSTSPKNGSFTGTTTYGPAGADLSQSSSRQLNLWPLLLCICLSVTLFDAFPSDKFS
uniref:Uncharacterized protein n=2 Tax=Oryza brachyantha TaxID=4533 RepID=J3MES6_ORYBR